MAIISFLLQFRMWGPGVRMEPDLVQAPEWPGVGSLTGLSPTPLLSLSFKLLLLAWGSFSRFALWVFGVEI